MPQGGQRPPAPPRDRPQAPARPGADGPNRGRDDRGERDDRPVRAPSPKPKAPEPAAPGDSAEKTFNQKAFDEIFDRGTRFADLGLAPEVLRGVTEAGFEFPTSIQAKIIPLLLTGVDVLGQAKTGTGKTAAFGLPLLTRTVQGDAMSGMVLVPTRELAIQVATDLAELGKYTGFSVLPVYGGQNINTQAQRLHEGPEIIVATPGRLQDMRERGYVHYRNIKTVILDEVDRMLDIGFRDDIRRILSACPPDRQTVFVSATLPSEVESLARSFARNAEKIVATTGSLTASLVKQWYLPAQPWDKKQLLLHLLTHESPALTIIFCRTKRTVDSVAEYLSRKGIDTMAIHGDMPQNKRNRVIEKLHAGSLSVLVASDLASRGLDVEGITHVINYDLPEDPDLYIHRIGRTARAGRGGVAWSLVTPEQGPLLTEIEILINAEIPKLDYPDFVPGPIPEDVRSRMPAPRRTDGPKPVSRFAGPVHAPAAAAAVAPAPATGAAPVSGAPARPATVAAPALDPSRFPGGIIPSKLPDRRMGGRVKTARSMRSGPAPAAPQPPAAEPPVG